jgi:carbonic anhydrase/acetyltransferase-like protein (isoleucine patch superfamily)
VKDDSKVFDGAGVLGNVVVTNGSWVSRDAIIRGDRVVDGETIVGGLRFIKG